MGEWKHGAVTVVVPGHIELPSRAGKMSPAEALATPKARKGIGVATDMTSAAMTQNPERLAVPGVDAARLAARGKAAVDIDKIVTELEATLAVFKQANLLLDAEAHEDLRRVLAFVRAQEKFDARIVDLVPSLLDYFRSTPSEPSPKV